MPSSSRCSEPQHPSPYLYSKHALRRQDPGNQLPVAVCALYGYAADLISTVSAAVRAVIVVACRGSVRGARKTGRIFDEIESVQVIGYQV